VYLRATYAERGEAVLPGARQVLGHPRLAELARDFFGTACVVPFTVYANVYLPGHGLHVHTDVPSFRGAEHGQLPAWLLVCMHHSGLFERWRIKAATVITYPFVPSRRGGGELTYHRTRPASEVVVAPSSNSAVVLDAESVFHGVRPVAGELPAGSCHSGRTELVPDGEDRWCLRSGETGHHERAVLEEDAVRMSISWKAYCFADDSEERSWRDGRDDLPVESVVPRLTELMVERGALPRSDHGMSERELAETFIDELVPFPSPALCTSMA
jgi:hypothetical protein